MKESTKNPKDLIRQPIEIVMSGNQFTGSQLNILYRGITQLNIDSSTIEDERIYPVTFNRADLPRVNETSNLKSDLEALQGLKIEKILGYWENGQGEMEPEWETLIPFPKVGYEKGGIIKLFFIGEYVRELLKLKDGYAVFHILEMFKLQGKHPKKLFEIFSAYKNRESKRYEVETTVLRHTLGVGNKFINKNQEFFDRVIIPAVKQINEKTSIEVKAAYTKTTRKRKGFYTFDVEHKNKATEVDQKPKARQMTIEEGIENAQKELTQTQIIAKRRAQNLSFTAKQIEEILRPDRVEWFNKWWFNNQSEIKGNWTAEIARGKYYGTVKA